MQGEGGRCGGSRSTDPKDIENEVKAVFEDSIGKEEAELVTKGIAQVAAETVNPPVQSTSGSQSTTPPANQSTTQSTTSSTSNTTQSTDPKQLRDKGISSVSMDFGGPKPTTTPDPVWERAKRELEKKNIAPVTDTDYFLQGFNSDYTDERPKFSTPITRASLWDDSRKELSHKGITETTDYFLDGFNEGYEDRQDQTILLHKRGSPNPNVSGYTGAWEPVQLDTSGSGFQIRAREESRPKAYEEFLKAYEDEKSYYDAIREEMARYEFENYDSYFMNSQWYDALSREESRVREQLSAIQEQYPSLEQAVELKKYLTKINEDDFWGQSAASFDVGQLTELTNAAYNQYLTDPTADNKAYADYLNSVLKTYIENNTAALNSEDAIFPLFSQTAAGYLPQLGHQLESGVGYGIVGAGGGAAVGSVVPVVGTASGAMTGFKGGYVAGVGVHSYEQVRGAAYRTMIEHGIDHETARAAAMDEAVVSALIEAADAGVDVLTFGLNSILGNIGNAAARKAITLLGKYGINVLGEGTEEGLQQSVSYANLDRVQSGDYDPNANGFERVWNLVTSSGETLQNAATGKDSSAAAQILDAMGQGAKLAALFGGPTAVAFDIASNPIQQTSSQVTVKPVQSPTERDIINTEKLWTQQLNEAAGIQSEQVQMVNADDQQMESVDNSTENSLDVIKSLDDFITSPQKLAGFTEQGLYDYLINSGYEVQPLSRGSFKGIPFEEGGGFKVNWGGDRILQYHPVKSSHHGGAYFKISSGETGTMRIDMDGNIIK